MLPAPAPLSDDARLQRRLDDSSDRLSPIVVKEVRQFVRSRGFNYSFGISLVVALAVAFYGSADALAGTGTSGTGIFATLTGCLAILGLAVVPFGAFGALRSERLEQTLDLISLTALTSRRIMIGKLLAQAVKLTTLFAVMGPFIAMSFLLGGIDFVTIVATLMVLFMWSLWMSAAALFVSTLFASRAISGVLFGGLGVVAFVVFTIGRAVLFIGAPSVAFSLGLGFGPSASRVWGALAVMTVFCLTTMVNLILLAENRLAPQTHRRVTPLRIGFLVQFLLIVAWSLSALGQPVGVKTAAVLRLGVLGGLHLASVALFAVTEGLIVSPWEWRDATRAGWWGRLTPIVGPGGSRAAVYVLVQMAVLVAAGRLLGALWSEMAWLLAICGFICLFTGLPALVARGFAGRGADPIPARAAVLVLLVLSALLPDVLYYVLWQPDRFNLLFASRHLLSPIRTLMDWDAVAMRGWLLVPMVFGATGVMVYVALIRIGWRHATESGPTPIFGLAPAERSRRDSDSN